MVSSLSLAGPIRVEHLISGAISWRKIKAEHMLLHDGAKPVQWRRQQRLSQIPVLQ
jgi:hypothetical protein